MGAATKEILVAGPLRRVSLSIGSGCSGAAGCRMHTSRSSASRSPLGDRPMRRPSHSPCGRSPASPVTSRRPHTVSRENARSKPHRIGRRDTARPRRSDQRAGLRNAIRIRLHDKTISLRQDFTPCPRVARRGAHALIGERAVYRRRCHHSSSGGESGWGGAVCSSGVNGLGRSTPMVLETTSRLMSAYSCRSRLRMPTICSHGISGNRCRAGSAVRKAALRTISISLTGAGTS